MFDLDSESIYRLVKAAANEVVFENDAGGRITCAGSHFSSRLKVDDKVVVTIEPMAVASRRLEATAKTLLQELLNEA